MKCVENCSLYCVFNTCDNFYMFLWLGCVPYSMFFNPVLLITINRYCRACMSVTCVLIRLFYSQHRRNIHSHCASLVSTIIDLCFLCNVICCSSVFPIDIFCIRLAMKKVSFDGVFRIFYPRYADRNLESFFFKQYCVVEKTHLYLKYDNYG